MSATETTIGGPDRPVTVHSAQAGRVPALGPYLADTWRRRRFVLHLARSNLKASHADTVFGQLWQILNPLMLGLVYFLVVTVIRGSTEEGYLAYLMGGLFLYYYIRNAMGTGAGSVVSGGGLLLNTAFPRAILPLASTVAATYNYLPTFVVYFGFFFLAPGSQSLAPTMLLIPVLLLVPLSIFALGMSMSAATATVYFRDTTSFLPYVLRIWLYLSPVLLTFDEMLRLVNAVLVRLVGSGGALGMSTMELAERLIYLNPMVGFLQVLRPLMAGDFPPAIALGASVFWALTALLIGGWYFLSNEREFAFRV